MKLFDVYPLYDVTPVKALDVYVYDDKNVKYLDLYGGHAVISIGHSHPYFIKSISKQLNKIAFYSNAIQNPLQKKLAKEIGKQSNLKNYNLFLCNSGAEAVENALKLASFHTEKKRIIAFKNSFHGRTSAAVAVTDNKLINSELNKQQKVTFINFNDDKSLKSELKKGDVCAIIFEAIQGVGGLDQPNENFINKLNLYAKKHKVCVIADEIQSGFCRTGDFFAFQKYKIKPHIITIAKGMGNGFPVGGILINPEIESKHGLLGTTFGGNHLACAASLSVLKVLKEKNIIKKIDALEKYFRKRAADILEIKIVKGRGLMLGIEFDFNVAELRKKLIYDHHIFTGGSSNKKLIRILPPLTIKKKHLDMFFDSLEKIL
jgi:acetylornithine/N-succinyldiaminopimelate aminotransferase